MKKGVHYKQTYVPVASWNLIRLLLTLSLVHKWKTVNMNYVLEFIQDPVDKDLYMNISKGFGLEYEVNTKDQFLKLHTNFYGKNLTGRVWYQHTTKKITEELGSTHYAVDKSIFYKR